MPWLLCSSAPEFVDLTALGPSAPCPFPKVLKELELTEDQFIDLCILCGCDYTAKISGIGAVRTALLPCPAVCTLSAAHRASGAGTHACPVPAAFRCAR